MWMLDAMLGGQHDTVSSKSRPGLAPTCTNPGRAVAVPGTHLCPISPHAFSLHTKERRRRDAKNLVIQPSPLSSAHHVLRICLWLLRVHVAFSSSESNKGGRYARADITEGDSAEALSTQVSQKLDTSKRCTADSQDDCRVVRNVSRLTSRSPVSKATGTCKSRVKLYRHRVGPCGVSLGGLPPPPRTRGGRGSMKGSRSDRCIRDVDRRRGLQNMKL